MEEFFTVQEIADKLKVNKATVYTEIKNGNLKAYKIGCQFRLTKSNLENYLQS